MSQHIHPDRHGRVEFAMTGLVAGIFAGTLVGFIIEVGAGGGELVMAGGAFGGLLIGAFCETCRFLWRKQTAAKRAQHATRGPRRHR